MKFKGHDMKESNSRPYVSWIKTLNPYITILTNIILLKQLNMKFKDERNWRSYVSWIEPLL